MRRALAVCLFLLIAAVPSSAAWLQASAFGPSAALSGQFLQSPIGAGGYVLDEHFSSDGTVIVNTDTAGAYVRPPGATAFVPVLTAAAIHGTDPTDVVSAAPEGVCATAISYTNSQHIYMYWAPALNPAVAGNIYSSTNRGTTWTKAGSGFPSASAICFSNGAAKLNNSYLAVSPAAENTLYVGTPNDGVWYTHDAGATWAQISTGTIPAGGSFGGYNQGNLIAFDPTDATGNIGYISSYGNGIWKCLTMLTTPSSCTELSSSGMPTTFHTVYVDPVGTLWVVDNQGSFGAGGSVLRYLSSTWSTQLSGASGNQWTSIAVDPASTGYAIASGTAGCVSYSTGAQGGSPSWSQSSVCSGPFTKTGSVIGWQVWDGDTFLSLNTVAFDPSGSHKVYGANGDGIYSATAPTTGTTIAWNVDQSQGIENLDLSDGHGLAGGGVQWTAQDRPLWYYTSFPLTYPSQYYPDNTGGTIRWGVSSCNNPGANTYAGINLTNGLTISTGGINGTYNYVANTAVGPTGFQSGFCVILDSSHWIWMGNVSGTGYEPYFTANSGSSWSPCTFDAGAGAGDAGWNAIAQDTTSPGVVVIMGSGTSTKGFWKNNSTTSCAFTQTSSSIPTSLDCCLLAVPGASCEFITYFPASNGEAFRITGCGATQSSAISTINSINQMGVGKACGAGNDGHAALFYQGSNNSVFSIWEIDNIDTGTPLPVDLDTYDTGSPNKGFPAGNFDFPTFITGDLVTCGLVYGGFSQSGGFYRHP